MWSALNAAHSQVGGGGVIVCVSNTNSYRLAARTLTTRDDRVLEVGSANGVTTDTLFQVVNGFGSVLGVDLAAGEVYRARNRFPHIQFENISGTDTVRIRSLRPQGFTKIFIDISGVARVENIIPIVNVLSAEFSPQIIVVKSIKLAALQKQLERGAALFRSVSSEKPKSLNECRAERVCTAPCKAFMESHGIQARPVGISFDKTKGQSTRALKRLEIACLGSETRVVKCAIVQVKSTKNVYKVISAQKCAVNVRELASAIGAEANDIVFVPSTKSALMPILGDSELVKVVTKYGLMPPFIMCDVPAYCAPEICQGNWCFEVGLGKFMEVSGSDIVQSLGAKTFGLLPNGTLDKNSLFAYPLSPSLP